MLKSSQTADNHIGLKEDEYPKRFLAAAPEVQMLVCVSVCVSVTLATTVLDF